MVFVCGAKLDDAKMVRFALRSVFGIGRFKANRICDQMSLHPQCRVFDLSEAQLSRMAKLIESDPDKTGHELQRKIGQHLEHLNQIKTQRSDRLARG